MRGRRTAKALSADRQVLATGCRQAAYCFPTLSVGTSFASCYSPLTTHYPLLILLFPSPFPAGFFFIMGYIITLGFLLQSFTAVQVVADFWFWAMRGLLFVLHIVLRPATFHKLSFEANAEKFVPTV
jgi:hypothetical protein